MIRTHASRIPRLVALCTLGTGAAYAQTSGGAYCLLSSSPAPLRAEGLTEMLAPVQISCSGFTPGTKIAGNFFLTFPVSVTNRVDANGFASEPVLSVDYGLGPTPSGLSAQVNGNSLIFNNVQITAPGSGNFSVSISNMRAAAHLLTSSAQSLVVNVSAPLPLNTSQVALGMPFPALYATLATSGVVCTGSAVPQSFSMTNLFAAGTVLTSARIREGFSSAFVPRTSGEDAGTRILVNYSGVPAGATLYVPDRVAGSDALTPTSGGDLGLAQAAGQYVPGSWKLLLVRVSGAAADGSGGTPLATPTGGTATLDSVTQVSLTGGSGYVVYEVADSNPALIESAQFPTFVAMAGSGAVTVAQEAVSLAPVSTATAATGTDPIPRFAAVTPMSDCGLAGDCQAGYFPKVSANVATPIQLIAVAGSNSQFGYIPVQNGGGGFLIWNVSAEYQTGSGWMHFDVTSGVNNGSVRVYAQTPDLAPGVYQGGVVISGGPQAGSVTLPVILTVQPAPPTVTISQIVNAATSKNTPLVPGSVAILTGSHLSGANLSLTVAGQAAQIVFASDTQIIFVVPGAVISQGSASVVVTAAGVSSAPATVIMAPAYPAIFPNAVLNPDYTSNSAANPAAAGSYFQIWAAGIPDGASVTAQIGNRMNLVPLYAGAAPGLPGLQQVNVAVPADLVPGTTELVLCATVNTQPYCSASYSITTD